MIAMSGLAPGIGLALVIALLASASGCSAHLLQRQARDPQLFLPGVLVGEMAPSLRLRGGRGGASSSGGEEHEDEDYSYDSSDQTPGVHEALQTSSAGAEQSSSISASPTSSSARATIFGTGGAGVSQRRSTRAASAMKIDSMQPPPQSSDSPEDDGAVALRARDSEEQDGGGWESSSSSSILQTRRAADSNSENQDEEENGDALSLLGDKDKSARGSVLTSSRHARRGGEATPLKVPRDETRGERDGRALKKRDKKKRERDAEQPSARVPEYPWEKGWVGPDGTRGLGLRGRLGESGEESSDDEQDGAAGRRAGAPAAEPTVLHVDDGEGETFSVVAKRGDVEVGEVEHWCDPDASSEQERQWERDNFDVFEFVDDVGCGGRVGADGALHDGSTVFLERVAEQVLNKTGRIVRCAVFGAVCGAVCEACILLGQTRLRVTSTLHLASFLFSVPVALCEMLTATRMDAQGCRPSLTTRTQGRSWCQNHGFASPIPPLPD